MFIFIMVGFFWESSDATLDVEKKIMIKVSKLLLKSKSLDSPVQYCFFSSNGLGREFGHSL